MIEIRPIPVILISFYCFLLGLCLFSLTANMILGNNGVSSSSDLFSWLPVGVLTILAIMLIAVGIGILYLNQWCWKILFFFLIISMATVASLIFDVAIIVLMNVKILYMLVKLIPGISFSLFAFSAFFVSEIVVLYYLTRQEVRGYFGEMGETLSPF